MKPEAAVVIALAKGDARQFREAARSGFDRVATAALAARHQVAPLCGWMWRNRVRGQMGLPDGRLDRSLERALWESYLHHTARNEAFVADVTTVQDAFASQKIEPIYFKGPWLVMRAYPAAGTRPVDDIDIGVREDDYRGAVAALRAAGYSPAGDLPEASSAALRRAHYKRQLRFVARGRRPVELHFRLVNVGLPTVDERWVWQTSREIRVGGRCLRVPGPEAALLHLVLHANQHGFFMLRLLHDIRWSLKSDRNCLDLLALVRRIRELRCGAASYHALALARELAGAEVPDPLLDALRPSALRLLIGSRVWRLAAVRRLEACRGRTEVESTLLYLLEIGRLPEKVRFLASLVAEAGGVRPFAARLRRILAVSPDARDSS